MIYSKNIDRIATYDVVVVGGGASGIAAAISAAQMGARVAIVEHSGIIGGGLTIGHIGPTMGRYEKTR